MIKIYILLLSLGFLGPLMAQEPTEAYLKDAHHLAGVLDSIILAQHLQQDPPLQDSSVANDLAFFNPPTDTLKTRLSIIDQKTIIDSRYNPSLESVIKLYLKSKRVLIEKMLLRSQLYFPLFERELDAQDMPLEIKYLAIVESALNPKAKSRVGATGLWQFMYGTGKMMGLEVNNYIDERQDPEKATRAAVAYLKKLHQMFGDWNLALAAYNSGPGNVRKAIRRAGGQKDFWAIRGFLPRETTGYVPALLTTMYLFEHATDHGLRTPSVSLPAYATDTIHLKKAISFKQLSKALSIPEKTIAQLNPVYKIGIVPQISGTPQPLTLPTPALELFLTHKDSIYKEVAAELAATKKPFPALQQVGAPLRYRVKSGDFLGKIAQNYGVRISDLKKWNRLKNNNLAIGQRLTVYPRRFPKGATTVQKVSAKGQKKPLNPENKTYTIAAGDSLWSIAQRLEGVSVEDLKKWNDIWTNQLKPGTTIKLCRCSP